MDRKEIIGRYTSLLDETAYTNETTKRRRGREFELLIKDLLEIEKLEPRGSFRPKGEEMDGSFIYNQKIYLLEAKWHDKPLPASSIYQFKGKVEGKLVGTIGIFISMSGYSEESVDALTFGKSLNIILFDKADFEKCIYETNGFSAVLSQKLRKAAESGLPFYSVDPIVISISRSVKVKKNAILNDLVIVVGGQGDQEIISFLANKILELAKLDRKILIRIAGGKRSIPLLANAFDDFSDGAIQDFMLVADADGEIDATEKQMLHSLNENLEPIIILPDPGIEIWFQEFKIYDRDDMIQYANEHRTLPSKLRTFLLDRIDIEYLRSRSDSFAKFYNGILGI